MGSSWQSFRKELYLIETKMALTYAVVLCFSVLLLDDNGVRAFIFPTAESYSFSRVTKKSLVTKESINNFPTANFVCNYDHKALLSLATSRIDTDSLSSSAATINRSPIADEIDGWDANFYPTFLSKYWQKKPLFIRNAIPAVNNKLGINRDLIFQLSRFDDVETRLITKNNGKWTKSYGPFTEKKLSELTMSKDSWTILVQEIDRHLPVVADLWDKYFNFIPSWRRDDVMVSYSIPGGGIGAHVDNYDVFLVQGKGRREWAIENAFVLDEEEKRREIPNMHTRLLNDFRKDQSWILNEGDMLYLPPRVPHRGTTIDSEQLLDNDCVTISMGFRSPNYQYLVTSFWDDISQTMLSSDNTFYQDPQYCAPQKSSGAISEDAIRSIKEEILEKIMSRLNDQQKFNEWLGKYLTQPLRFRSRKNSAFFLNVQLDKVDASSDDDSEYADDSYDFSNDSFDDEDDDLDIDEVLKAMVDIEIVSVKSNDNDDNSNDISYEDEKDLASKDSESIDQISEIGDPLPFAISTSFSVASQKKFDSAEDVMLSVINGQCNLRRAEGVKMAYIDEIMFIDGEAFPLPQVTESTMIGEVLCDTIVITSEKLSLLVSSTKQSTTNRFIAGLIRSGYYYPVDRN